MTTETESLYNRLGGADRIAAIVDEFVDHLRTDPIISKNPHVVQGFARLGKAAARFSTTLFMCDHTGGPQKYHGRTMIEAHANLAITQGEWEAFTTLIRNALAKFEVPEREARDFLAIVEGTRRDIVKG